MKGVERLAAPRTSLQQHRVSRLGTAAADLVDPLPRLVKPVGADFAADPDADVDGGLAQPRGVPPAKQLERADHPRRALELLAGQQPQGVTHERHGPAARVGILQASPRDQERNEAEIRLRLAAAGGEPDEVQDVPVVVVFPDRGLHGREQEGQLEGTPPVPAGCGVPASDAVGLTHLVEHRPVCEPERLGREQIGAEHLDAPPHALEGDAHPVANPIRGRLLLRRRKRRGDAPLIRDPVGVAFGETGEFVRCRRRGKAGKIENRVLAAGLDGHHRDLGSGHEVGPDPRCAPRLHLPVHSRAVTDGIDALLPVLELELLLLVRQQARIDARILDELAGLDHALEPRLEQGLPYPVLGSLMRWGIRVQLLPIAQGHGKDEPIPMRPRANVEAGTRLPDRFSRLARHRGTRPRDGLFREQGTGVLASLESTSLTAFPGSFIDGRGNGDRETHVAPDEAGEANGRRRHVSTPAGRLGERALLRFTIRERRIFRVVVERGIDSGKAGINGVEHPRRIALQRRHPEAPLAGRTNELSAQPGHQLLPGLDVHHVQPPAKIGAAGLSEISKSGCINMILRKGTSVAVGTRHAMSERSPR